MWFELYYLKTRGTSSLTSCWGFIQALWISCNKFLSFNVLFSVSMLFSIRHNLVKRYHRLFSDVAIRWGKWNSSHGYIFHISLPVLLNIVFWYVSKRTVLTCLIGKVEKRFFLFQLIMIHEQKDITQDIGKEIIQNLPWNSEYKPHEYKPPPHSTNTNSLPNVSPRI